MLAGEVSLGLGPGGGACEVHIDPLQAQHPLSRKMAGLPHGIRERLMLGLSL